ncbi:MAG TPA: glycosyltransferase 87 family protein [Miltoncostaeaceae bacterium]|nr:glycosyltransferase 87 family protein [Miltoncostaeaceae bacterium]
MSRRGIDLAVLAAIGAGVVAVAAWSASWEDSRSHAASFTTAILLGLALWAAGAAWILRRRPRGLLVVGVVLLAGLGARLALVPHAPDLSGDIHRYVWDGRVQAEGINPYRYAPDDPVLAGLRDDEVWPGINRKPVTTIYPPVAEGGFLALHLAGARGVVSLKLAFALIDGIAAVLLLAVLLGRLGRPPALALVYAWHPLPIIEIGRSGHVDGLAVALLLAALLAHAARRPLASGALLAGAALVKFYAAAVLPALLWVGGRRSPKPVIAFAVTAAVAYLPYLGVGSGVLGYLPGYLEEEGFETGRRFYLLGRGESLLGDLSIGPVSSAAWYAALAALVMGAVAAWCLRTPPSSLPQTADRAVLLLLTLMLLSSPTYPWYLVLLTALIPLASVTTAVPAAIVCAAAPLLYLQWWLPSSPSWPLDVTWGAGAVALVTLVARAGGPWRRRAELVLRQRRDLMTEART